ncbi:hypothetical protein E2C01_011013 [Portunus trituberculatus]|uniref:Uncharacterized protein n=1 Tax=Portunus trituberculatus TaxID=210409 RepID=A0A5B7DA61_PORTR|nr:hypothetical protein [Portunus trituberculatus]
MIINGILIQKEAERLRIYIEETHGKIISFRVYGKKLQTSQLQQLELRITSDRGH